MNRAVCWIVALAAGLCLTSTVSAQYQLGDGRRLDNNLQAGSGGFNGRKFQSSASLYQNALINGNVSGLGNLRANVGYRASGEFHDQLGSNDLFDFNRRTAGLSVQDLKRSGQGSYYRSSKPTEWGGSILFRSGSGVSTGDVNGYGIRSNTNVLIGRNDTTAFSQNRGVSSAGNLGGSTFGQQTIGLASGADGRRLQVDTSPLTGVKFRAQPVEPRLAVPDVTELAPNELVGEQRRVDPAIRVGTPTEEPAITPTISTDSPAVQPIMPMTATRVSLGEQIGSQLLPGRAARSDVVIIQKSADDIEKRLDEATKIGANDDAYAKLAEAIKERAEQIKNPTMPQAADADPLSRTLATIKYDLPLVGSLAGQSKTLLNQALADGDTHMAKGNFFNAEQAYDRALLIQRGHPMALMGKAHAQLGAGLFLSAARTLRSTFADHPELIATRYDANLMPSTQRLATLTAKLNTQTQTYSRDVAAPLLLAYLAYQSKNAYATATHMETLIQRSPDDPLLPLLKQIWLESPKTKKKPESPSAESPGK